MFLLKKYLVNLQSTSHFITHSSQLMMFMKMLDYVKLILEKVSFESSLFEKELKKSLKLLSFREIRELKKWCYEKFGSVYRGILNKTFRRTQVSV